MGDGMGEIKLPKKLEDIAQSGRITAQNVNHLRGEVFQDQIVGRDEAQMLLQLDHSAKEKSIEWSHFFVEAFVDYIVHQAEPSGVISEENAKWLIKSFEGDGFINSAEQLEALVKILEHAKSSPESLMIFALSQVSQAIMKNQGPVNSRRNKGEKIICRSDVELIRRLMFGFGGDGGLAVTKAEAEFLFDLNDQTIDKENDPTWSFFFVRGVANYLLTTLGNVVPNRQAALQQDKWFQGEGLIEKLVNSLRSVYKDIREGSALTEEAYANNNAKLAREGKAAAVLTTKEVQWVIERIVADDFMHENEIALLQFLQEETGKLPTQLKQLLQKAA